MNVKQDRLEGRPAVGCEHHESGKQGTSQGDLQVMGQRIRWKIISWPHLGQSMLSRQDVAGQGVVFC